MNETDHNEPTIKTQQPDTETSPQPSRPINLPIVPPKPKWYERKLLRVALAIAFVIGGAGTGYAYYAATTKQADTNPVVASETPKPSPSASPKTYAPFALQYTNEKQATVKGTDCLVMETTVYQQPIAGGDSTATLIIPDYQLVAKQIPVRNNHVVLITAPSCYSKDGPGLWLSKDAGKTYTQLYKGTPHPKDNFGEQITSALFTNDEKSILFASAPNPDGKGTVKKLDIGNKEINDLFTASEPGVHLQGYDQKNKKVFYYAGCYNCAGNSLSKPIVHDLANDTDTPLFDDKEHMSFASTMNSNQSKILRVKYKGDQYPKIDLSYVIEEYDISAKKATVIASFKRTDDSGVVSAGYTADGSVYYTNDKDLFVVSDGKPATLLRAPLPIMNVHHVDKKKAIFSQGDQSGGSTVSFTLDSKGSTKLVDYKYPMAILGISLQ